MAGNKEGGRAMVMRMIKKHGSYAAWKEHMREIARKGGRHGTTGGFASSKPDDKGLTGPERAKFWGRSNAGVSTKPDNKRSKNNTSKRTK